jgi:hypothetical protein
MDTQNARPRLENPAATRNHLLEAALACAARGWHVFPVHHGGKQPEVTKWEQRATCDPERIRRWWGTRTSNIGLACGPSNLVVVDLDRPKGGQQRFNADGSIYTGAVGYDQLADAVGNGESGFGQTFTVATPSGGFHLYFAHPETGPQFRNTAGKLADLVDTRSHGGYVLAPGSTFGGKLYNPICATEPAPLPAWLHARLSPAERPAARTVAPARQIQAGRRSARLNAYVTSAVTRETEAVAAAPEGTRNHRLYTAAVALGQLVAAGHLDELDATEALTDAAGAAGLGAIETARTIASGLTAGAKRPRHLPETTN